MPVREIYKKLLKHFGPQNWWPADTEFEVIVGAILTQNTNWKNVERAIENLKTAHALRPSSLLKLSNQKLERLIKPSGFYRQKAKRLKGFTKEYYGRSGMSREELLRVKGIGPETADSILLYAFDRPTFVVDAYTKRIGQRVGLFRFDDYHEIKAYFEKKLPKNLEVYKEYHALLVELAKNYCKTKPLCGECPVVSLCKNPHPLSPSPKGRGGK
ncbi:MAG: endonuclease III domain-containing protein [Candidatus Margulisiibacteriota bacterium]|nr:endonuclease III domain-containing protein [Candidatus Margulisiibacteriota bacterium]